MEVTKYLRDIDKVVHITVYKKFTSLEGKRQLGFFKFGLKNQREFFSLFTEVGIVLLSPPSLWTTNSSPEVWSHYEVTLTMLTRQSTK